tara:strand:+ start:185 stop:718 length:534 start_codon:yes stop_codon:yes gene_type:complete
MNTHKLLNFIFFFFLFGMLALSENVYAQELPQTKQQRSIQDFQLDYPELPPAEEIKPEHLYEMQEVYELCETRPESLLFKNCRCYSMQFLAARLETPTVQKDYIYPVIKETCNDPGVVAGYYYNTCFNNFLNTAMRDWEKLCTCYANYIARETINLRTLSYGIMKRVRRGARNHCDF